MSSQVSAEMGDRSRVYQLTKLPRPT